MYANSVPERVYFFALWWVLTGSQNELEEPRACVVPPMGRDEPHEIRDRH
jgi:hypothetical protein